MGLQRLGSIVLEVKGLDGPSVCWLSTVTELVDLAWPYKVGLFGLPPERRASLLIEWEGVVGRSVSGLDGCTNASL